MGCVNGQRFLTDRLEGFAALRRKTLILLTVLCVVDLLASCSVTTLPTATVEPTGTVQGPTSTTLVKLSNRLERGTRKSWPADRDPFGTAAQAHYPVQSHAL